MPHQDTLIRILRDVLQADVPATADAGLLGVVPEFDSMAVVAVITAMEEEFGFIVDDDDITADDFETVGTLCAFVDRQYQAA